MGKIKKLTQAQYEDVLQLMDDCLVSVENDIRDVKGTEFEDLIPMYQEDHAYGMLCLEVFKDCRDFDRLIKNLRDQDTEPKEVYWKVFELYYAFKEKGEVFI